MPFIQAVFRRSAGLVAEKPVASIAGFLRLRTGAGGWRGGTGALALWLPARTRAKLCPAKPSTGYALINNVST